MFSHRHGQNSPCKIMNFIDIELIIPIPNQSTPISISSTSFGQRQCYHDDIELGCPLQINPQLYPSTTQVLTKKQGNHAKL